MARRLNPDHDLWAAAQPVVERWIRRELGPQAQVREAVDEVVATLRALSQWAQRPPEPTPVVVPPVTSRWVVAGVVLSLCLATGALLLSLWQTMV